MSSIEILTKPEIFARGCYLRAIARDTSLSNVTYSDGDKPTWQSSVCTCCFLIGQYRIGNSSTNGRGSLGLQEDSAMWRGQRNEKKVKPEAAWFQVVNSKASKKVRVPSTIGPSHFNRNWFKLRPLITVRSFLIGSKRYWLVRLVAFFLALLRKNDFG